jgi:hypothetical protein
MLSERKRMTYIGAEEVIFSCKHLDMAD